VLVPAVVVLTLGLAGCGGGSGGGNAKCSPYGDDLRISAQGSKFDTECLAAAADKPFTITFDNNDAGTPHNVDILGTGDSELFNGELVTGVDQKVYLVTALHPGTYRFRCEVHPSTMQGTFIVK
jgi:plastocyanin